jgi:hypothetical protein
MSLEISTTSSMGVPGASSSSKRRRSESDDWAPSIRGGEHRLAADIGAEEERGSGEQGAHAVEPVEGESAALQEALAVSGKIEGRIRQQRERHQGAHRFAPCGGGVVVAGCVAIHGAKL